MWQTSSRNVPNLGSKDVLLWKSRVAGKIRSTSVRLWYGRLSALRLAALSYLFLFAHKQVCIFWFFKEMQRQALSGKGVGEMRGCRVFRWAGTGWKSANLIPQGFISSSLPSSSGLLKVKIEPASQM